MNSEILILKDILIYDLETIENIQKEENDVYDYSNDEIDNNPNINNIPKKFTSLKTWPRTTEIRCWYCSCNFDTIPIFIPSSINQITNDEEEYNICVHGCFCSFNCAKSYIIYKYEKLEEQLEKEKMLCYLFNIFNNIRVSFIIQSVNKYKLVFYGGNMCINKFKKENEKRTNLLIKIHSNINV